MRRAEGWWWVQNLDDGSWTQVEVEHVGEHDTFVGGYSERLPWDHRFVAYAGETPPAAFRRIELQGAAVIMTFDDCDTAQQEFDRMANLSRWQIACGGEP